MPEEQAAWRTGFGFLGDAFGQPQQGLPQSGIAGALDWFPRQRGMFRAGDINQGPGPGAIGPGPMVRPSYSGFGGQSMGGIAPQYSDMVGANQALLTGQTPSGALAGSTTPLAQGTLGNAFMPGFQNFIGGHSAAPGQATPFSWTPDSQNTGFANDPTQAIESMLSGTPQYDQVQAAVTAGAQPTLDMLFEDVMPALRQRTVSTNNPTGEIKSLNRIVPRVMRDITNTGTQAALGEYNRAMGSQERGAGLAGQLGAQYAGMGLGANQFGANLGQDFQRMQQQSNQFNAGMGMQGDVATQGAWNQYVNSALGLGNLAGQYGGDVSSDMTRGAAMFPSTLQTGMTPFNFQQQYGQNQRGFAEAGLQDAINSWNFNQTQPYRNQDWYMQQLSGAPGLGGTMTSSGSSNPMLGAAGGALGGAGLGTMMGATGGLMGAPATATAAAIPALWPFLLGGAALGGLFG
jgi:hypothetical protein